MGDLFQCPLMHHVCTRGCVLFDPSSCPSPCSKSITALCLYLGDVPVSQVLMGCQSSSTPSLMSYKIDFSIFAFGYTLGNIWRRRSKVACSKKPPTTGMEILWDQGGVRVQQRVEHSKTFWENFTFWDPVDPGLADVSTGKFICSWPAREEITGNSGDVQVETVVI